MKFKVRIPHINDRFFLPVFGLVLALAAFIRFWAAPLSSGVDVPQFWAFARVFQIYGIDFYRYAGGTLDIFPTQGWGFVYPPVWLLILRLVLIAAPIGLATETMVATSWRLAEKTPIIAADLAIGCLLYWAVPGPKWRKLVFATLWLLHPAAWYQSAVFGQFDAVAAVFLLAAVILLQKGKDGPALLLAGLAVMTKQHTFIPVVMMLVIIARGRDWRRLIRSGAILIEVVLVLSIPFLLTGNFISYARSVFLPGQSPGYQNPLVYAFNGFASLLTYMNNTWGWATGGYIKYMILLLVLAVIAGAILIYKLKRSITPAQGALVGFLILLTFTYRVNYQYLVVYIPLALLVASETKYLGERILTIALALLPAVWMWLFDVSFWFTLISPASPQVVPLFEHLGLTRRNIPDIIFVSFALVLTGLFLAYETGVFTRWRKPQNDEYPI